MKPCDLNSFPRLDARLVGVLVCLGVAWGCGDPAANNQPPIFSSLPGEVKVKVGDSVDLTVTAEDPEGAGVTLGLDEAPTTAEFIAPAGIGRFHWAPLVSDAGLDHDVVFSATDSNGGRATARVRIVVDAPDGAPRFVTPPQRVLDLSQNDTLIAEVKIKDDDSGEVDLSLEDAPKGMALIQLSDKGGELSWTPSPEQIATQSVWTATLVADDGTSGRATQTLSVILIAKKDCSQDDEGQCGCAPPEVSHDELDDQREIEDYFVKASITDSESSVGQATLFFTTGDPEDLSAYTSVPMEADGERYSALIPNPLLEAGEAVAFSYFICAVDDDDPNGETCDNLVCVPEEGKFGFTAFAPGDDETCRSDDLEPNDSVNNPSVLEDDAVSSNLTICEGDSDFFAVEVEQGDTIEALITYTADNGNLALRLFDTDGQTLIDAQDTPGNDELIVTAPLTAGTYILEVSGTKNNYDILVNVQKGEDEGCTDMFEPNESAENAPILAPGTYEALNICTGDADVYGVTIAPGDVLEATIFFAHEEGDLDMVLLDVGSERVLSRSVSIDDNETVSHRLFERSGNVIIAIEGFDGAINSYDLVLEVTPGDDGCPPDAAEPNDTAAQASRVVDGDNFELGICPNEQDFFAIALDEGERVEATIEFNGDDADLDLFFIAPDGEDVLITSEGVENIEQVRWTAEEGGNHFISALGFEGDSGAYALSVRTCDNDTSDPNDTPDQASPLLTGLSNGRLCLGEEDWYSLSIGAGQLLLIDIEPTDTELVSAGIFEADGTTLVFSLTLTDGRLEALEEFPEAGTYLLRVLSADSENLFIDYDMTVEIE